MQAAGRPAVATTAACRLATWLLVPRTGLLRTWTWPSIVIAVCVAVSAGAAKPEGVVHGIAPSGVVAGGSSPLLEDRSTWLPAHKSPAAGGSGSRKGSEQQLELPPAPRSAQGAARGPGRLLLLPGGSMARGLSPTEYEHLLRSPNVRNVTTQLGQTMYLHCVVDSASDRMKASRQIVSWIRLRDFHLLTVGLTRYTSDERFQTVHMQFSNNWALQIRDAQLRDAGLYECLVNSDPPLRQVVSLRVVVPKAKILGGPDLHVEAGSALNLTCSISESPEAPAFVFWYHQGRLINFERGGRVSVAKGRNGTALSRLLLPAVDAGDSGNYTCKPANANATWVLVHVLESHRRLAAVQNDAGGMALTAGAVPPSAAACSMLLLPLLVSLLLQRLTFAHHCGAR
ncbi:basigin-like [Haemaphysalis longicornis]